MNQNSEQPNSVAEPSEAKVRSGVLLESVQRFNQFTWWVDTDGGRTTVGDFDCNQIEVFPNILSDEQVIMWIHGYETGHAHGTDQGKIDKAFEIKRALGL